MSRIKKNTKTKVETTLPEHTANPKFTLQAANPEEICEEQKSQNQAIETSIKGRKGVSNTAQKAVGLREKGLEKKKGPQ